MTSSGAADDDAAALTLPEELLLITLDPRRGKLLCRRRSLQYAAAGAVLAELEGRGHITEERGRMRTVDSPDPVGPLLAPLLHSLGQPELNRRGISVKRWVRLHGRYAEVSHLDALVERGVLRREHRRVLGLFGYHRHFPGEPDLCATVREDFAAAEAAGFPLLRSRQLAALLSAIGLAGDLTGRGREGRSAMKALRRQQWTARAVRQNVKQDEPSGGDSGWGGDGDCGGGGCGGGGD